MMGLGVLIVLTVLTSALEPIALATYRWFMSATIPTRAAQRSADRRQRLLENGQSLTGDEFMRRYEAMPEVKKAELIEGTVFMGAPVRSKEHAEPDGLVHTWLGFYAAQTPGMQFAPNCTSEDGYILGAPELVAEVASSSVSLDLQTKLEV